MSSYWNTGKMTNTTLICYIRLQQRWQVSVESEILSKPPRNHFGTILSLDQLSKLGRLDPPMTCFKWTVYILKYHLLLFLVIIRLELLRLRVSREIMNCWMRNFQVVKTLIYLGHHRTSDVCLIVLYSTWSTELHFYLFTDSYDILDVLSYSAFRGCYTSITMVLDELHITTETDEVFVRFLVCNLWPWGGLSWSRYWNGYRITPLEAPYSDGLRKWRNEVLCWFEFSPFYHI